MSPDAVRWGTLKALDPPSQPRANLGAPFDFKRPLRVVWLPKCHGTSAGAVLSASPRRISARANLNRTPLLELELSINSQEAL